MGRGAYAALQPISAPPIETAQKRQLTLPAMQQGENLVSGDEAQCDPAMQREENIAPGNSGDDAQHDPAVQREEDLGSDDSADEAHEALCYDMDALYGGDLSDDGSDDSSGTEDDFLGEGTLKCTCGAGSRAHSRGCPRNSRQRYPGAVRTSDTEPESKVEVPIVPAKKPTHKSVSKADVSILLKPPPAKKRKTAMKFRAGDYVGVHSATIKDHHVPCRIAEVIGNQYRLCCNQGVLKRCYAGSELTPLSSSCYISL